MANYTRQRIPYTYKHHHGIAAALVAVLIIVTVATPVKKLFAGNPTVYSPQGPQSGGWFTAPFSFHVYVNCQSGVQFESFYSGSLDGTNTYNFDTSTDGSLLVRFNSGGEQLIYSCGSPNTGVTPLVSYTTKLDTDAPSIGIGSPANGAQTTASSITVTGSASDAPSGVKTVTVNGAAAAVGGGSFSGTAALALGANVITVTVTDFAGHSTSANVTVTRVAVASPPPASSSSSKTSTKSSSSTSSSSSSAATETPAPVPEPLATAPIINPIPINPAGPKYSIDPSTIIRKATPINYALVQDVQTWTPIIIMGAALLLLIFAHRANSQPGRKPTLKKTK